MDYFTTFTADFGPLAWTFFVLQIVLAGAGVYLGFVRTDAHQVRGPALRRLGYALLAVGALGIIVGALRLAALAPFTARYWFYVVAAFELALAFFAAFYYRTTYQEQMAAASRNTRRGPASRQTPRQTGHSAAPARNGVPQAPVMVGEQRPVSKRRDSRRERKRRKH